MVGLQTLTLPVGVRIPASQLLILNDLISIRNSRKYVLWGILWGPLALLRLLPPADIDRHALRGKLAWVNRPGFSRDGFSWVR